MVPKNNWRTSDGARVRRCSKHCLRAEGHEGQHRRRAWGFRQILGPGACDGCGRTVYFGRLGFKGGPAWRERTGARHYCRAA